MTDEADRHRQRRYNLSPEEYAGMVDAQPTCAICDRPWSDERKPQIDHHHYSDPPVVRMLLCRDCNVGIGNFQESISRLASAILYLEHHPSGGYTAC